MISYASIDRIEGNIAVCEVELVDIYESLKIDFDKKETITVDIPMYFIEALIGKVEEGDILIVDNKENGICWIYGKDNVEKQRRADLIKMFYKNI